MLLLFCLDFDLLYVFCLVAVACFGGRTAPEFLLADFAWVLTIGETLRLVALTSSGYFLRALPFFLDFFLAGCV